MIRGYALMFEERGQKMFVAYGDTRKRVQKLLDFAPQDYMTCPICLEEVTKERGDTVLTCHGCMVGVCGECTVKQLVANSGVMVCCNCRHTIGTRMPMHVVNQVAQKMLYKLAYGES